jgi:5-methyltetrahydropteroyltriglutamate--homocysteine methyltransferase
MAIEHLKGALQGLQVEEAFLPAIAPGSFARFQNQYYPTDEAFLFAIAEAMREEYKAIVDAGFILQIDDPGLPDTWDMFTLPPTIQEYRQFAALGVAAVNHALAGIPEDRVRYHICWGSWQGPHVTDIPLKYVVDLMLQVKAHAYSVEAANPRHAYEWHVWLAVKLPAEKILIPGVSITGLYCTNIVGNRTQSSSAIMHNRRQ